MFVSGPINTVRLEGEVNGIKKIIYIMMDVHFEPDRQTECDDVRSTSVREYIVKQLDSAKKNNNKMYDIFFERKPTEPYYVDPRLKGNYFNEMISLFSKNFNINFKNRRVSTSKLIPNTRFHYADVRGWLLYDTIQITYNLINFVKNVSSSYVFSPDELYDIKDILHFLSGHITSIQKMFIQHKPASKPKKFIFTNAHKFLSNISDEDYERQNKVVVDKIMNRYENKNVKEKINEIVAKELMVNFDNMLKDSNNSIKKINEIFKSFPNETPETPSSYVLIKQNENDYSYGIPHYYQQNTLATLCNISENMKNHVFMHIGALMMDIYLMRRFLDKKYITNAISYTGAHHSLNYIRWLIKYFDFKITHYSYLNGKDVEAKIKKTKDVRELSEMFYPKTLKQCSDLSSFPVMFE